MLSTYAKTFKQKNKNCFLQQLPLYVLQTKFLIKGGIPMGIQNYFQENKYEFSQCVSTHDFLEVSPFVFNRAFSQVTIPTQNNLTHIYSKVRKSILTWAVNPILSHSTASTLVGFTSCIGCLDAQDFLHFYVLSKVSC